MYNVRNSFDFVLEDPAVPPLPAQQVTSDERIYRPRRPHTKSRNGCSECRRRRMKCGEERPVCLQCSERDLKCQYRAHGHSGRASETNVDPPKLPTLTIADAFETNTSPRVEVTLAIPSFPNGFFADQVYCQDDVPTVLNHFLEPVGPPWIGSRTFQHIMQTIGIEIASKTPYLMHTILAFSAAHLSHRDPQSRKWRFAALAHYDYALSLWQNRLTRIPSPERDLDARLSAIVLHAMLAILHSTAGLKPGSRMEAWKPGYNWLPSVLGIQGLLHGPGVDLLELDQGIWSPLLRWYLEPLVERPGLERHELLTPLTEHGVLANLYQVCKSGDPKTMELYRRALDLWHGLVDSSPSQDESEAIDVYLSAASQLTFDFGALVKYRDTPAILLVGFWLVTFGKQCRWWWIAGTVRTKCRTAVEYLRAQPEYSQVCFARTVDWMLDWVSHG